MIDTAVAYGNQKIVGKAIKSCIDEGIITRSDIFVTTKLWLTDWKPEDVERSVRLCLEELQLEYIDLFLIHQSGDEKSLDWLLTLADPSAVWNAALGSYDMDLALLVAVHSQKDPQEYRSLLQRYRDMRERKKRYCIDVELKRWSRVLKDISDLIMHCDEIDEELGDENVLWKQAVRLMREKSLETEFLDDLVDALL